MINSVHQTGGGFHTSPCKGAGCLMHMTSAAVGWASVCMSEELQGRDVAGPRATLRVATC